MRTRTETVVSIDKGWTADNEEDRMVDRILPEGVTDWFVTDYDGCESLWYVKDGKLYNEHHKKINHEGSEEEE